MPEDLRGLSSEDIRRFEKTVSEAKALTARQEEIAKKVLATEKDIGKIRLASLNEYFDAYSKGLDEIVARKTSQLNDAFLIMEQKAVESLKRTANEASKQINSARSSSSRQDSSSTTQNNSQQESSASQNTRTANPLDELTYNERTSREAFQNMGTNGSPPAPPTPPTSGSSGNEPPEPPEESVDVYSTVGNDATSNLVEFEEARAKNIADRLAAFSEEYKTTQEQLDAITTKQAESVLTVEELEDIRHKKRTKQLEEYAEKEKDLASMFANLMVEQQQADAQSDIGKEARLNRLKDLQINNIQEVTEAELKAQRLVNDIEAEQEYMRGDSDEGNKELGRLLERQSIAEEHQKSLAQLQKARNDYIAQEELKAKRDNNGILKAEEAALIRKQAAERFKFDEANLKELTKLRAEKEAKEAERAEARERDAQRRKNISDLTKGSLGERVEAFNRLTHDEDTGKVDGKKIASEIAASTVSAIDKTLSKLGDFAKKLENTIDNIGSYKNDIDTRLQGSSNQTSNGSYWEQIVKDMTGIGAVNPFYKQSDFAANIKSLVDQGIAFDLEQRAFLMTIQNKIANTFEVADGTLLKLIRIQQQDTTAGRLGMEASLNAFLNSMYENTEYLKTVADSVRGSLAEMESLMEGAEAAEVEYQVQKWLGSLYSVGMSESAINSISTALGQIAAGQIEGLVSGGAGNLLVMAANDAGLSIADILTGGINSDDTNSLLQAVVNYLAEIAESSKDNRVVQQQLADVFGVKASDLRAATNLSTKNSISTIYDNSMSYENMLYSLTTMASTMGDRTSLSEKMTNIWENVQYSIAGSMASSPAMYMLYKVATVLDDTTGGISIPAVSVLGNMVDLQTTVADLMRVGAMAGGIIGSFGDLMSGLSNSFDGQAMLSQLGIESGSGITVTPRGDGVALRQTGGGRSSTSSSGYVGNSSSSDIRNSTMQEAADTKKQLMVEAQEAEEANQINVLNATVLKIYELLDDVAHGSGYFRVKVENYGLTKSGSSSAQGGVGGLGTSDTSIGSSNGSGGSSLATGGVNYGGLGGSVDFGGWTTVS